MAMLGDKLRRVLDTRAEVCTAADNSCLMHIGGALRRQRAGCGRCTWPRSWRRPNEGAFPPAAHETLQNAQLRRNLGKATTTIRAKRLRAIGELPDWEALRDAGAAIKARAMATLPEQLERLEASVTRAGGTCTGRATGRRRTRSSPASRARTARAR